MPNQWEPIHNAVKALSGVCDGAVTHDKRGFNGGDSRYGKQLAMTPELSPRQAANAYRILKKYTKQLAKLGVDYAALIAPTPEDLERGPAASNGQPGGKVVGVDKERQNFRIVHPYEVAKAMIPKLAVFPGRRFTYQPFPHWLIPANLANASRILDYAIENDYEVTEAAMLLYDEHMAETGGMPLDELPPQAKHPDRFFEDGKNRAGKAAICVHFGFSAEFKEIYGIVSGLDNAQFQGQVQPKHWTVGETARNAIALLKMAKDYHFSIPPHIETRLTTLADAETKTQREFTKRKSVLLSAAMDITTTEFGGKRVREYQLAGISFMLDAFGYYEPKSGVILADDVGLGKTFEAMLVARCFQRAFSAHVFIACPKSLMSDWVKEAEACGVRVEVFTWSAIPKPVTAPYIVIGDECHYMQDIRSQRSKAMFKLVDAPACLTYIPASATPMRGTRPKNIFSILKAVRHPLGKNQKAFEEQYCNRRKRIAGGRGFWDVSGSAHLDELMREIAPIFLQRFKKDVLKDLPPLTVIGKQVEISDTAQAVYDKAFKEAQAKFSERRLATEIKIRKALAAGKSQKDIEFTKEDAREGADAVVLLTHLRRAASLAMIEPAIEEANDILETGEKVILYSEFPEVCAKVTDHYNRLGIPAEILTGEVSAEDREKAKQRFQFGLSRVFCLTKAGGVGLTLTAASNIILIDQPWMWDDVIQIGGRIHRKDAIMEQRIKEKENPAVMAYMLKGFEINEKIQARLLDQRAQAERVATGDHSRIRAVKSLNQIAKEIADELFGQKAMAA